MTHILSSLTGFITNVISSSGYIGVAGLMALESSAVPLPSEVIMPFAGYLVSLGRFSLIGIALAGAVGSAIGSAVLYGIGYYGGRPLLEKYGRYILIRHKDIDHADRFFARYGNTGNFIGRMLPVVRTFISFPAGVARVNLKQFLFYSFVGSFIWSLFLGYIGLKLGQNWETLKTYFHGLDYVIGLLIVLGVVWYIRGHLRHKRSHAQ
ncbi:MAG: DedA family protein [Candidatus Doudnabacteria bacterium]